MIEFTKFLYDFKYLLVIVGIYLFYKLGKKGFNLHLKLGHEGPPPLPFVGNLFDLYRYGMREFDRICLQKYGRLYPFYFGKIKVSIVADEELLKQILVKESKCFTDKMDVGFHGKSTKKMLTVLKGKDWQRVRSLISPIFTSGKLKRMSTLISDSVQLLEERLAKQHMDRPLDVKEFFGALTMDVIARTMFGIRTDAQTNPNNLFIRNAKKLLNFSPFNPFILLFFLFQKFARLIPKIYPKWEVFNQSAITFLVDNLKRAIEQRKGSSEEYNDFISLMLRAHEEIDEKSSEQIKAAGSRTLTNEEIMAQSLIFLLAGYETTSTTLNFLSYFLALNPDVQSQIYGEILNQIGAEGDITYDSLMNMPILDAAINETLRLCTPVARFERVCTQDVTLTTSDHRKIIAKKGDIFSVPVHAIHTDPSLWPNPDSFNIKRFDPENRSAHSPYSFMPFGMGPRSCIGMRFALLEAKWAITAILQRFKFVPCAETVNSIKFTGSRLANPTKPILLKVVKRS